MKILLTGSEGFIGQHLQSFLKDKHQLICLDKLTGNDLVTCNLDYDVDLVIHLAGLSGVRDSLDNPTEYWTNNVVGSYRIFKQFDKGPKILYASSSTAKEPWRNPYAMSKFYMEQIAPHNALGMRFTTVYGPGAREQMLIPKILKNDVDYINIDHSRDFIHIDDILTAVGFLIVNKPPKKLKVVDVGTGISNKLIDIFDHLNMTIKDKRMGTIYERKDNVAKIGTLSNMGWIPQTNLLDYLKENYDN
jgi:nucleoside-diphosphate-sugar epimerase